MAAKQTCDNLIIQLGWTWNEPRLQTWLKRVQQHYSGFQWVAGEPIPEFVLVSLAKFLDLRLKCTQLLKVLGLSWNNPQIQEIHEKYKHGQSLPLKGYQELYNVLNAEYLKEDILF